MISLEYDKGRVKLKFYEVDTFLKNVIRFEFQLCIKISI